MPLFTVDSDKCKCDGLCAAECPLGCIVFAEDQIPVPHEKKYAYCIECGHCMAVCPTGAFRLDRFDGEAVVRDKERTVSSEQAMQFLKERRSVRAFKADPIGRDLLAELLDLTQYAPSGHNARPVRWAVAASPDKVHTVAEATANWMRGELEMESHLSTALHMAGIVRVFDNGTDLICRGAPALAVALVPRQGITPMADGIIALTYLELAATGAGFGACWCGYVNMAATRDEGVRRALGIPDGFETAGALMLGKPVRRYRAIPPRPAADVNWL